MYFSLSEANEVLYFTKILLICDSKYLIRHRNTETQLDCEIDNAELLFKAVFPLFLFNINTRHHIYLVESNRNGLWLSWVLKKNFLEK